MDKVEQKGTEAFPSSISYMDNNAQIQAIAYYLNGIIEDQADIFLVDIRVKPTHNYRVFIDGDQGVNIDRLVKINRQLYKKLEESGQFPAGEFSLEVSSPGLSEPLKMHRQYLKNINRFVEVDRQDGSRVEGKLLSVNEAGIEVEETKGQGKKKTTQVYPISFDDIKTTKIQIKF